MPKAASDSASSELLTLGTLDLGESEAGVGSPSSGGEGSLDGTDRIKWVPRRDAAVLGRVRRHIPFASGMQTRKTSM